MANPRLSDVVSHWDHLFENMQYSPQEFYERLEGALSSRNLPDATYTHVEMAQGSVVSGRRVYLRARRKEYIFDVCGAPFGNGFFVSWWLSEPRRWLWIICYAISALAAFLVTVYILFVYSIGYGIILGAVGAVVFYLLIPRQTYYKIDTQLMFQHSVHFAVMEVLDEITKVKGVRALAESERKPIMRDFLNQQKAIIPNVLNLLKG